MSSHKTKKVLQESGRWLRVGTLSVSVLSPVLTLLANRLRAQAEADQALAKLRFDQKLAEGDTTVLQEDLQNRLQSMGATISDLLDDLRNRDYSQELLRRGELITDELKERGNQLSQLIGDQGSTWGQTFADRGGDLSQTLLEQGNRLGHKLADRSSDLSQRVSEHGNRLGQTLADRGSDLSQRVSEQSNKLSQTLADRSNDFAQDLFNRTHREQLEKQRQKRNFWVAFGFGLGLTAAGITTYIFLRKRMQEQVIAQSQDEAPIQLPETEKQPPVSATVPPVNKRGDIYAVKHEEGNTTITPAIHHTTNEPQTHASRPGDAAFVGISSTRHYYPIETPLDKIASQDEAAGTTDIIYFTTEKEAQLSGFSAAEV